MFSKVSERLIHRFFFQFVINHCLSVTVELQPPKADFHLVVYDDDDDDDDICVWERSVLVMCRRRVWEFERERGESAECSAERFHYPKRRRRRWIDYFPPFFLCFFIPRVVDRDFSLCSVPFSFIVICWSFWWSSESLWLVMLIQFVNIYSSIRMLTCSL